MSPKCYEVMMDPAPRFREYDPYQVMLLPSDPQDWLSKYDVAYRILDVVGELNLSSIYGLHDGSQ